MKVIMSLSQSAYVTSSVDILSHLMSYYILSDAAQSIAFQDNIINLPETYYKNINNPEDMRAGIKDDLDKILSRYFVNVDVETRTKELSVKKYAILLHVAVIDSDNIKTELTKVTEINSAGLRKILAMNNLGEGLSYLASI